MNLTLSQVIDDINYYDLPETWYINNLHQYSMEKTYITIRSMLFKMLLNHYIYIMKNL